MSWRISVLKLVAPNRISSFPAVTQGEAGVGALSRVPDDVLHLVFSFVARAEPIRGIQVTAEELRRQSKRNLKYPGRLGWMRLSAVCRRWRLLLLSSAPLWADIVFSLPAEMASLALTRSVGALLDMHIPAAQNIALIGMGRLVKTPGLGEPDRERLLKLASTHASRMRCFAAADMAPEDYRAIFGEGTFDYLSSLILDHGYRADGATSAPTRDALGNLRIHASRVYLAHLSIALPIAYNDGPGFSLWLPNLRYLHLKATPGHQIENVDDVRWVSALLRGTTGLKHLMMDLPVTFTLNWDIILGEEPMNLPALRGVDLGGPVAARIDRLFSRISGVALPWMRFRSLRFPARDEGRDLLNVYGDFLRHALCTYPLDTVYISAQSELWENNTSPLIITGFSSYEVTGSHHCVDALFEDVDMHAHHFAELKIHGWEFSDFEDEISMLPPLFEQHTVRELYLNNMETAGWSSAMSRFLRLCLSSVTTLHCIEQKGRHHQWGIMRPCTDALRVLTPDPDSYQEPADPLPELEPSDSASVNQVTPAPSHRTRQKRDTSSTHSYVLPALHTIVVSMWVAGYKKKFRLMQRSFVGERSPDVGAWWESLIDAVRYRRDIGLPVRTLRIIGGWTSEKLRRRTARLDESMLQCAAELVNELVDERKVDPDL